MSELNDLLMNENEFDEFVEFVDGEERVVPQSALFAMHILFKVILADDTSYDGQAYLDNVNGRLNVQIFNSAEANLVELFQNFTNPAKTSVIRSQKVDLDPPEVFEGYTSFVGIRENNDGSFAITLGRSA